MNYFVPGNGITEIYHLQSNNAYTSELGNNVRLEMRSNRKAKSKKPSLALKGNNGYRTVIYLPKKFNKRYGYGNICGTNDLVVLEATKSMLEITTYENGWLYFDILFLEHINNKCN